MTTKQISLLDFRSRLGELLKTLNENHLTITSRGKPVGMMIDIETAKKVLEWEREKEEEEKRKAKLRKLRESYKKWKPEFEKYGKKFLEKKGLKEEDLSVNELVDLVANA